MCVILVLRSSSLILFLQRPLNFPLSFAAWLCQELFNSSIFQFFNSSKLGKLAAPGGQVSGAKWPSFIGVASVAKWSARRTQSRARSSYAEPQPSLAIASSKQWQRYKYFLNYARKTAIIFSFGAKYSTIHLLTLSINGLRSTMLMRDMALYSLIHLFKYDRKVFRKPWAEPSTTWAMPWRGKARTKFKVFNFSWKSWLRKSYY